MNGHIHYIYRIYVTEHLRVNGRNGWRAQQDIWKLQKTLKKSLKQITFHTLSHHPHHTERCEMLQLAFTWKQSKLSFCRSNPGNVKSRTREGRHSTKKHSPKCLWAICQSFTLHHREEKKENWMRRRLPFLENWQRQVSKIMQLRHPVETSCRPQGRNTVKERGEHFFFLQNSFLDPWKRSCEKKVWITIEPAVHFLKLLNILTECTIVYFKTWNYKPCKLIHFIIFQFTAQVMLETGLQLNAK